MITWPEFINLRENQGLSIEQMRRNYMWYLHFLPRGGPSTSSSSSPSDYLWLGVMDLSSSPQLDYPLTISGLGQTYDNGGIGNLFPASSNEFQKLLPEKIFGMYSQTIVGPGTDFAYSWYVGPTSPDFTIIWNGDPETYSFTWQQIKPITTELDTQSCIIVTIPDWENTFANPYFTTQLSPQEVFELYITLVISSGDPSIDLPPYFKSNLGNQISVDIQTSGVDLIITLNNVYRNLVDIQSISMGFQNLPLSQC